MSAPCASTARVSAALLLSIAVLVPCLGRAQPECHRDEDCSDSDACNGIERCERGVGDDVPGNGRGVCLPGVPVVCLPIPGGACRGVTACDPRTGECAAPPLPDGTPCDDGDACTSGDSCQAGSCRAGTPRACEAAGQCRAGACNPSTGLCEETPRPDGMPCDDGDACTSGDSCEAGTCRSGTPRTCDAPGQCGTGACNPSTGLCEGRPRPDGTRCDDGNGCTRDDVCRAGVCTGTTPVTCDDHVACTEDRCVDGACRFDPHPERCIAAGPGCVRGECQPDRPDADGRGCISVPVGPGEACTATGGPCVVAVCRDGACVPEPVQDGTPCDDDGVACTDDVCRAGACAHPPSDARCAAVAETDCGVGRCAPGLAMADANGCVVGALGADGASCAEDYDPCTDDSCLRGVCIHENVRDRRSCDPVEGTYHRALALADVVTALQAAVVTGIAADAEPAAGTRRTLDDTLTGVAADLDAIVRILSGRLPADAVGSTLSVRRARAALAVAKMLVPKARGVVQTVRLAARAGSLGADVGQDLVVRARALLADARTLRRELKRLQRISRVFAR